MMIMMMMTMMLMMMVMMNHDDEDDDSYSCRKRMRRTWSLTLMEKRNLPNHHLHL